MRKRVGMFSDDDFSSEAEKTEPSIDLSSFKPNVARSVPRDELAAVARSSGFITTHGNKQEQAEEKMSRQFNIRVKETTANKFFSLQERLGYKQAGLLLEQLLKHYEQ
jgi:hypothetical protein